MTNVNSEPELLKQFIAKKKHPIRLFKEEETSKLIDLCFFKKRGTGWERATAWQSKQIFSKKIMYFFQDAFSQMSLPSYMIVK